MFDGVAEEAKRIFLPFLLAGLESPDEKMQLYNWTELLFPIKFQL